MAEQDNALDDSQVMAQIVDAAVISPRQDSYVIVKVTITTTVPNPAQISATPQTNSPEVVFVTVTDTTYVLPENTGFVGAPNASSAARSGIYNSSLVAQPTTPDLNASSTEIPTSASYFNSSLVVVQTTPSNDLTNPINYSATPTGNTPIAHEPNRPTSPASASSFYSPNISSTTVTPIIPSSTAIIVQPITGGLLSSLESHLHTLESTTDATSPASLLSHSQPTPPAKASIEIITTVRPAYIYSLSGRPIYTSPATTIIYTSFPPGASFQAPGPVPGFSFTKPDSPASSLYPIVTSKSAPHTTSAKPPVKLTVPPAPPVSSAKARSSSVGYPAGFTQGAHCPYPYPGESCAWRAEVGTRVARNAVETHA
ncbi:hypothetical protein AOQ84DRAFT_439270 [Glonium stellatum]|uniref:Uncharacterized protein n=1 Tax=Glonium stellatum TaxID=574774 RepID=A0A8E2F1X0_9PEZI|nr:hypothetical protein AOQ84DRAFT_439270 [Glonium stellatum]